MNNGTLVDPSKPAFSLVDDNLEEEFLNSGNPFLSNNIPKAYSPAQQEQQDVVYQIRKVEQSSLDSTKRTLQAIAESEQIGVETAKNLVHQREQLENTNKRLDMIQEDLKSSDKDIKAMGSSFNSFKQWLFKKKPGKEKERSALQSPTGDRGDPNFDHNPALEKAVSIAPPPQDPSLRIRGIDYSETSSKRYDGPVAAGETGQHWRETTAKVNRQIDDDLEDMSFGLSRLKGLAQGLNTELTQQNDLLETIGGKAEKTDLKLGQTNKNINSLLKK